MNSLYGTPDTIGTETGGGVVTKNELLALKEISSEVTVIEGKDIAPAKFHQPDSPFLQDYFTLEQIKDKHFDLAHFYSGCFSQTIRWLKSRDVKVSYTVAAHNRKVSIEEFGRLGLEYPFHHIKDDDLWDIYVEGIRLADMVIAPSKKSAEFLKSGGCKNVVVIPHGVNLPRKVKPIAERFDCGYLGAVGPDKSLIDLIRAWALLSYSDSTLILAGSETETLEPFIRQTTNNASFILLGRITSPSDLYNACSVYIQPSVTEAFGIEVLEAMAHGRPVIVSQGAGASDLVEDGVTGFVVPIRSPEAIAEKINLLKSMPLYDLMEMGQRARQKSRKFTWGKIRKRYAQLFSTV